MRLIAAGTGPAVVVVAAVLTLLAATAQAWGPTGHRIVAKWHGKETNMHAIWDEHLIDTTRLSYSEFAKSIDNASEEAMNEWKSTGLMAWLRESYDLRDQAYTPPGPEEISTRRPPRAAFTRKETTWQRITE